MSLRIHGKISTLLIDKCELSDITQTQDAFNKIEFFKKSIEGIKKNAF